MWPWTSSETPAPKKPRAKKASDTEYVRDRTQVGMDKGKRVPVYNKGKDTFIKRNDRYIPARLTTGVFGYHFEAVKRSKKPAGSKPKK